MYIIGKRNTNCFYPVKFTAETCEEKHLLFFLFGSCDPLTYAFKYSDTRNDRHIKSTNSSSNTEISSIQAERSNQIILLQGVQE